MSLSEYKIYYVVGNDSPHNNKKRRSLPTKGSFINYVDKKVGRGG